MKQVGVVGTFISYDKHREEWFRSSLHAAWKVCLRQKMFAPFAQWGKRDCLLVQCGACEHKWRGFWSAEQNVQFMASPAQISRNPGQMGTCMTKLCDKSSTRLFWEWGMSWCCLKDVSNVVFQSLSCYELFCSFWRGRNSHWYILKRTWIIYCWPHGRVWCRGISGWIGWHRYVCCSGCSSDATRFFWQVSI